MNTIVAGDPEQGVGGHGDAGAAYVFVKPAGEWTNANQTAELTASDPNPGNDEFGTSVAISGDTVVAGAPLHKVGTSKQGAAYVFVMPAGGWTSKTQNAELTASDGQEPDELGGSVAVSGGTVVAGARKHQVSATDQGAAYVFTEPSGGWSGSQTQAQELTASDASTLESLGESVAISGNTILAGAPRHLATAAKNPTKQGAAYVFEAPLPTIKKLSPKKGTTAGGTQVTITGTNFTGVTAVKFGSIDGTIDRRHRYVDRCRNALQSRQERWL